MTYNSPSFERYRGRDLSSHRTGMGGRQHWCERVASAQSPGLSGGETKATIKWALLLVLVVVLGVTLGTWGAFADAVILVILLVSLVWMRLQYVKSHPPDPELVSKPFWER